MKIDLEPSEWDMIDALLRRDMYDTKQDYKFCDTPFQKASFTKRINKAKRIIDKIQKQRQDEKRTEDNV